MKTIQFTDQEIDELNCKVTHEDFSTTLVNKITLARMSMSGCIITEDDESISLTPAKAFEKVSERTQAARIENDKRHARRMIDKLSSEFEQYKKQCKDLNDYHKSKIRELQKENEELQKSLDNINLSGYDN